MMQHWLAQSFANSGGEGICPQLGGTGGNWLEGDGNGWWIGDDGGRGGREGGWQEGGMGDGGREGTDD